jgi:hypothetical protein
MSDNYYDDDNDQKDGPKALRDLVEKLQKELKAEKAAREASDAEKATLSAQVKKSSLASLLKAAGVPEKFAARADKDGAEATEDGVKAWIDENKDFYNFGPATPVVEVQEPDGEPNVSPEMRDALAASRALDSAGVTPSDVNITDRIQSISATTEEQLLQELRALGVQIG